MEAGKEVVKLALAVARRLRRPALGLSDLLHADLRVGLDTAALDALIAPPDPAEVMAALLADRARGRQLSDSAGSRRLHTLPTDSGDPSRLSPARHRAAGTRHPSGETEYREPRRAPGEIGKERAHRCPNPPAISAAEPGVASRDRPDNLTPTIAQRRAWLRRSLTPQSTAGESRVEYSDLATKERNISPAARPIDNDMRARGTQAGRQELRQRDQLPRHGLVRLADAQMILLPKGPETHAEPDIEAASTPGETTPEDLATPKRIDPDPAMNHSATETSPRPISEPSGQVDATAPVTKSRPRPIALRLSDDAPDLAEAAWRNGVDAS